MLGSAVHGSSMGTFSLISSFTMGPADLSGFSCATVLAAWTMIAATSAPGLVGWMRLRGPGKYRSTVLRTCSDTPVNVLQTLATSPCCGLTIPTLRCMGVPYAIKEFIFATDRGVLYNLVSHHVNTDSDFSKSIYTGPFTQLWYYQFGSSLSSLTSWW